MYFSTLDYRCMALLSLYSRNEREGCPHTQSIYSIHTPGFSLPSNSWSRSAFLAVTTGPHTLTKFLFFSNPTFLKSKVNFKKYFLQKSLFHLIKCVSIVLSWLLDSNVCVFFINNRPCVSTESDVPTKL